MPIRSQAQRRWMWATHPEMAAQWEKETPKGKLPERVGKKKKKKYEFGGDEEGGDYSDFFNTLADAAISQQQQSYQPVEEEPAPDPEEEPSNDYEDLQNQISELKSQLEERNRGYDPDVQDAHRDDEFMSMLFSDEDNSPIVFGPSDLHYSNTNYTASSNVPVGQKEEQAFQFFKNKGLPDHVAAGIAGNIKHESNFNSQVVGDAGKAKGFAQWHPDRYQRLKAKGFNLNTDEGNLEAIYNELNTTERKAFDKLLRTKTPEEAAVVFDKEFERSAGRSTQQRINSASSLFRKMQGKYTVKKD